MSEEKNLEQVLKEKNAEIEDLKKKLKDRNPAFNGNLLKRAEEEAYSFKSKIGEAIAKVLPLDLLQFVNGKRIYLYDEYSSYNNKRCWRIEFEKTQVDDAFKERIADIELRRFQESLDNFSWAVQSQGGG